MATSDPGAGADDQHVVELHVGQPLVRRAVLLGCVGQSPVGTCHGLVRHPVDPDREGAGTGAGRMRGDLVVRRPADAGGQGLGEQHRGDDGRTRHSEQAPPPTPVEHEQGEAGQCAPHHGGRPEQGQQREGADPDERAEQVVAVRRQRRQVAEATADGLGRTGQCGCDENEDHRQGDPRGRAADLEGREVDDVAALPLDADRKGQRHDDEDGQQRAGPRQHRPRLAADQEAQADPEEGAEQHEVREVAQVHDVGAQPADERELQEQHQRAGQQQPRDRSASGLDAACSVDSTHELNLEGAPRRAARPRRHQSGCSQVVRLRARFAVRS